MKDYNFFEDYVFKSNRIYLKYLALPFVFIILIGALLSVYFYNSYSFNKLTEKHDEYNALINSQAYINTMSELENIRNEITLLRNMEIETDIFRNYIITDYIVTEEITEMILNSIPRNLVFSSYAISKSGVVIDGFASNYSYIAEFENNLRGLNRFENIFVEHITSDGGEGADEDTEVEASLVSFSIDLRIGGESDD